MSLKRIAHTAGNKIRYLLDYNDFLEEGMSLTSGTVVLDPAFTATVTDVTITGVLVLPSNHLAFFLQGGSVNETFTLDVQIVDSRGEIKNDTLAFYIIAP